MVGTKATMRLLLSGDLRNKRVFNERNLAIITIVWACALGWIIATLQIEIKKLKRENELLKLKVERLEHMAEKKQLELTTERKQNDTQLR